MASAFTAKPHTASRQSLLANMQQQSLTGASSPKSVTLRKHETKKAFIPNHARQSSLGRLQKIQQQHNQLHKQPESYKAGRQASKHSERNSSLIEDRLLRGEEGNKDCGASMINSCHTTNRLMSTK